MNRPTKKIHRSICDLGEKVGLVSSVEVSNSVLSLALDEAYRPRVDIMWSLPLSKRQGEVVAGVTGLAEKGLSSLPLVAIEVEGTTPSTKVLGADLANIAAAGTKAGLLVVSEAGEPNIYRRAARAVRSIRRSYGDLAIAPVEAGWLPELCARKWDKRPTPTPPSKASTPWGGEKGLWPKETRRRLRALGEAAGFSVVEPYVPGLIEATFKGDLERRPASMVQMTTPMTGKLAKLTRAKDYLTECQIDMAWLLPLPRGVRALLEALIEKDRSIGHHGLVYPELYSHVAVVGFELETTVGKHAAGGLLNLAAYASVGVTVCRSEAGREAMEATLQRYRPTLGLRNLFVRATP